MTSRLMPTLRPKHEFVMSQVRKLEAKGFPARSVAMLLTPMIDGEVGHTGKMAMREQNMLGVLEMTDAEMAEYRYHVRGGD